MERIKINIKRVFGIYGVKNIGVAKKMGITQESLSTTIATRPPKFDTVERIAAAVGCNPLEFFEDYVELEKKYQQLATKYAELSANLKEEEVSSDMSCPHCGQTIKVILK